MALDETMQAVKANLANVDMGASAQYILEHYIKKIPVKYPSLIIWSFLAMAIFIVIIYWNFVRFPNKEEKKKYKKQMWGIRVFVMFTRMFILLLLFIALASPYTFSERVVEGEPSIMILSDSSQSFDLFDTEKKLARDLKLQLEKQVPTSSMEIASGTRSAVGDGLLGALRGDDSVILVSDGTANYGRELGDVLLLASKLNTTINALDLKPERMDTSVVLTGPSAAIVGSDVTIQAEVTSVGVKAPYTLVVDIDGTTVVDTTGSGSGTFPFTKKLTQGPHKLTARLLIDENADYFAQNNQFYKTVHVLPKPKILLVAKRSVPIAEKLQQLYDVTVSDTIGKLDPYAAVIIDDVSAKSFSSETTDKLTDYLTEGGGLFVIGGENGFDYGDYKDSVFELLLPVKSGKADKKPDDRANIILVIDISGSTGGSFGSGGDSKVDVEKALAVKLLEDINPKDRVGIVAFNSQGFVISPTTPLQDKQEELIQMISSLKDGGGTNVLAGILEAERMLVNMQGSNNIILISDGVTTNPTGALERMQLAQQGGIKTYAVGVGGDTNEEFMQQAATVGKGIYFQPTQAQHLKILFGDPEEKKGKTITMLNENHFITKDVRLSGEVSGFNQVVPKSSATLLITTSAGDPLLSVWRFGLGRVAALSTDDGTKWGAAFLSAQNSKIFTKILNWAIGDPSKTRGFGVFTEDARLGENTEIILKSDKIPRSGEFQFEKIDEDTFSSYFLPTQTGFFEVLGNYIGVSYQTEYEQVGINSELKELVSMTGGELFEKNDIEGMIDKAISTSKRKETTEKSLRWPFFMAAILLFFFEILVRKVRENR